MVLYIENHEINYQSLRDAGPEAIKTLRIYIHIKVE